MTDTHKVETPAQTAERTLDQTSKHSPENSPTEKIQSKSEIGTSGKGMPTPSPALGGGLPEKRENEPGDAAIDVGLSLPHERDQQTNMTKDTPDPVIVQASRDVKNGLKDTSNGAETDKAYERFR